MLNVRAVCTPRSSVTRAVNANVPAEVGVPEMRPELLCVSPGGSLPAITDQR